MADERPRREKWAAADVARAQARWGMSYMPDASAATPERDLLDQNKAMVFDEFFLAVQGLLGSAANISKIFWPIGGKSAEDNKARRRLERGHRLRKELAVPDDSPLRARAVRNHFEHMDERLDEYALSRAKGLVGALVSTVVMADDGSVINESGLELVGQLRQETSGSRAAGRAVGSER
jgi:hypothetical protein